MPQAQVGPGLINMGENVIAATRANHFFGFKSGDPFRGLVPERDGPVVVNEIETIVQFIQNGAEIFFVERAHASVPESSVKSGRLIY